MNIPSKVLWADGLDLSPQIFQQQDRYHEARLHQTAKALHPYTWGVRKLAIDTKLLLSGTLRLLELSAVFPEGEMCDAPASDPLPAGVDLAVLGGDVQTVTYYAALPWLTPGGGNMAAAGEQRRGARFCAATRDTADLFTQGVGEQLSYLQAAVRLVSDQEPLGAYERFPLVRLRRAVSGGFELDPSFVAPSLSLDGAPALVTLLEQLMEALEAKVKSLQGNLREPTRNVIEFRSGDVSSFWLLHSISTAAAALTHYVRNRGMHPERLFEALLGLAGSLMTYSKTYALTDLPTYEHENTGDCFGKLDGIVRDLLETVISARYFAIALEELKPGFQLGKLDSGKIDQNTALYLAVSASMPALELVDVIPQRIKIGAPSDVEQFVLSALPGVKLSHAPQVPAAIPVRPETYYFSLDSRSALYEHMLKAQAISIYAPSGMPDLRLELVAVAA
ncbi:type VI secretion system baseplate subunit TssK [Rugamonas sp. CCM 8940]|uniref:type VI secretion system baseplate subunit TssK n=1 Tax=Rugamonas sp. CCM 8940 TaxID=2765359 RepID=UPI0018F2C2D7|nr:type VI secretion system baseplate subunit TssK [Rugamonas sp. CCM 8940]MBJ7310790.1 type VI secretion system baseplate subunit TssK [Rugamonas sp. CCM 8940]